MRAATSWFRYAFGLATRRQLGGISREFSRSLFAREDHQGGRGAVPSDGRRDLAEDDGEDQDGEKGPNERPEHASTFDSIDRVVGLLGKQAVQ